jgi:hypothetical protein
MVKSKKKNIIPRSSEALGLKAEKRRIRISVFGGSPTTNAGSRTHHGRIFNKKIKEDKESKERKNIPIFKGKDE